MQRNEVKIGMYVEWKGDYEESGKVISIDKQGWVTIEGPDSERGPQEFNVHCSQLEEA